MIEKIKAELKRIGATDVQVDPVELVRMYDESGDGAMYDAREILRVLTQIPEYSNADQANGHVWMDVAKWEVE